MYTQGNLWTEELEKWAEALAELVGTDEFPTEAQKVHLLTPEHYKVWREFASYDAILKSCRE